jgi:uncharacterized surface protein with fasciclin (FAS1) repeats
MQTKFLALAALASTACAQSLTELLSNTTQLSNLTTYLGLFPQLSQTLSQLTNVTILAPSNDAFMALMNTSAGMAAINDTNLVEALLTYHVLNGTYSSFENTSFVHTALMDGMYANVTGGQVVEAVAGSDGNVTFVTGLLQQANTTGSPVNFTGGVVHIIDAVLTLPQNVSSTAVAANLTAAVGALTKADLASTVDELMDVTIFVPSNEAFDAIGNLVGNLTKEDLTKILEYHVINGTVAYSTSLMNMSVPTLGGENVTISIINDEVFVNSAKVTVPNVLVANGVVHVIDAVLNPSNTTAMPNPSESTAAPAFSGASSTDAGLTSGVPTPTQTAATESAPGATSSSSSGGAMPMATGAVNVAALFGGGAAVVLANL